MEDKNPLKMKVTELKVELGRRGLSQIGLKFDLAQRLQTAMDVDEFGVLPSLGIVSQPSSTPVLAEPDTGCGDTPPFIGTSSKVPDVLRSDNTVSLVPQDATTAKENRKNEEMQQEENRLNGSKSEERNLLSAPQPERELDEVDKLSAGVMRHEQDDGGGAIGKKAGHETVEGQERSKSPTGGSLECEGEKIDEEHTGLKRRRVLQSPFYSHDKGDRIAEEKSTTTAVSVQDTSLLLLNSTDLVSAATVPQKDGEDSKEEGKGPAGAGVEHVQERTRDRRGKQTCEGLKEDSRTTTQATEGTVSLPEEKNGEASKGNTRHDGSSELLPDPLLLCSHTERMKEREQRFRREVKPDGKEYVEQSTVEDITRCEGLRSAGISFVGHKVGTRYCESGGIRGDGSSGYYCNGSSQPSGSGMAEDARTTKLIQRKVTSSPAGDTPSRRSKNVTSAKMETQTADCSSSKTPVETVLEDSGAGPNVRKHTANGLAAKMARRAERFGATRARSCVPSEMKRNKLRDPRGSFFCQEDDIPEGISKKQSPAPKFTPGKQSFEVLPRQQKRDCATWMTSWSNGNAPAERREVGGGEDGVAEEERATAVWGDTVRVMPPSGAVVTPVTNFEVKHQKDKGAKRRRRSVPTQPAEKHGIDNSGVCRPMENPLPPRSGKSMCPASTTVLFGAKRVPDISSLTSSVGDGVVKRFSRGPPDEGKDGSTQFSRRNTKRKSSPDAPRGQREGQDAPSARPSHYRVCRDDVTEKKAAEQAAKMAERRQRFAEHPLAPSFG